MKEDLNNFQSQIQKPNVLYQGRWYLLLLLIYWKENFLLMDDISQWGIAALIGTSIAAFMAWFNKSGSDFKDGFEPKRKGTKKNK